MEPVSNVEGAQDTIRGSRKEIGVDISQRRFFLVSNVYTKVRGSQGQYEPIPGTCHTEKYQSSVMPGFGGGGGV